MTRGATLRPSSGGALGGPPLPPKSRWGNQRCYPVSEVRGGNARSYLASKIRAGDERSYPTSEVRGCNERSYLASKVRGCGRVVFPSIRSQVGRPRGVTLPARSGATARRSYPNHPSPRPGWRPGGATKGPRSQGCAGTGGPREASG